MVSSLEEWSNSSQYTVWTNNLEFGDPDPLRVLEESL